MSVPRYDRFLLVNKIGRDRVLRRYFTAEERWCWVAGVLGTSADSPIRGWLLLTEKVAADRADVADAAGVSEEIAASTIAKAERFGLVEHDTELNCFWVPDWEMYNPPSPKVDHTNADRQARYRATRKGESNAKVTDGVTPDSNGAGNAPQGSKKETKEGTTANAVETTTKPEHPDLASWFAHHQETTGATPTRAGTKARQKVASMYAARRAEGYTADELCRATVGAFNDPWRRERGYYGHVSVLGPEKVHDLIEKGRRDKPLAPVNEHPADRRDRELAEMGERLRREAA